MLLIVFTNCVYALLVITTYIMLMLLTLFIEGVYELMEFMKGAYMLLF
jgi:hypothetical protein